MSKSIKIQDQTHEQLFNRRSIKDKTVDDVIITLIEKANAWDDWQKHCDEIEQLNKQGSD